MPAERRERAIAIRSGQPATGGTRCSNGRRQPSCDGTSRMNREVQVRFCEGLGVKFPGPTRQSRSFGDVRSMSGHSPKAAVERASVAVAKVTILLRKSVTSTVGGLLNGPSSFALGGAASIPGSLSAAIALYFSSLEFHALAEGTKAMRRNILEGFREQHGDKPIAPA